MKLVIAIDGPAGSGKGTVTKKVAEKLKITAIDTGAMYRCVALSMIEKNVKLDEIEKIEEILKQIKIEFREEENCKKVFLNGRDVTKEIRTVEVTEYTSPVSTIGIVRQQLVELQREMAESQDVIMEGRDIGTCVFPNANVKIYLDATPEERAQRRYKQNLENGINTPYEEILQNVIDRDYRDSHREISPLTKADDAIYLDSTNMTIDEVVENIINITKEKMS